MNSRKGSQDLGGSVGDGRRLVLQTAWLQEHECVRLWRAYEGCDLGLDVVGGIEGESDGYLQGRTIGRRGIGVYWENDSDDDGRMECSDLLLRGDPCEPPADGLAELS